MIVRAADPVHGRGEVEQLATSEDSFGIETSFIWSDMSHMVCSERKDLVIM